MQHVWVKLPVVDRIHPQSNTFATGVESQGTGDSKLNNCPGCRSVIECHYQVHTYMYLYGEGPIKWA